MPHCDLWSMGTVNFSCPTPSKLGVTGSSPKVSSSQGLGGLAGESGQPAESGIEHPATGLAHGPSKIGVRQPAVGGSFPDAGLLGGLPHGRAGANARISSSSPACVPFCSILGLLSPRLALCSVLFLFVSHGNGSCTTLHTDAWYGAQHVKAAKCALPPPFTLHPSPCLSLAYPEKFSSQGMFACSISRCS
jgi:hypothetical protein